MRKDILKPLFFWPLKDKVLIIVVRVSDGTVASQLRTKQSPAGRIQCFVLRGLRAVSSLGVSEGVCTGGHAAGDGRSNGDALAGAVSQEEGAGLPRLRSDMLWEPIYLGG